MTAIEISAGEKYPHLHLRPADEHSDMAEMYDVPDELIAAHKAAVEALRAAEQAIAGHVIATGQAGKSGKERGVWAYQVND